VRSDLQITKPRRSPVGWILLALMSQFCQAQTTQGLIAGKVFDGATKQPLAHAAVEYFRHEQGTVVETGSIRTDGQGFYAFGFLPPGTYQVRVSASAPGSSLQQVPQPGDYQPQEIHEIELFVASRLDVNWKADKRALSGDIGSSRPAVGQFPSSA
jgi:Carboxypeptidase regulatory-like domain